MKKTFKAALMAVLCAVGLTAAFAFTKSSPIKKAAGCSEQAVTG